MATRTSYESDGRAAGRTDGVVEVAAAGVPDGVGSTAGSAPTGAATAVTTTTRIEVVTTAAAGHPAEVVWRK
jgi:hypothetical protein